MAEPKVDKDKKEFVQGWMSRIRQGITYKEKYSTIKKWPEWRKMYRGQWDPAIVPVNEMFSYGRAMVPRVYFRSPRVSVTATRPDMVWHAKVVESIDNQLIRETFLKKTLKRVALDGFLSGLGVIKLGYDSEFGYQPDQAVGESGETVTQIAKKGGERIEYQVGVKPGMPWALRTSPEDIVVPWGATDAESLPWIANYILRPLEDIKQDQKYQNVQDLVGTRSPEKLKSKATSFSPRDRKDKDVTYGELWEVRDWRSGEVYVFCEDYQLLSTKDELQIEGLPYEFLIFNEDPEFFWPIPDASIMEPQQKELNEVRTQTSRHRAISLIKFLYLRSSMKEEELNKLLSGFVGPGVAVDGESIAQAVQIMQPHIPPELWREAQEILQDIQEEMGAGTNQWGQYKQGTPPTKGEASIVEESFNIRVDERKDIMGDLLVNIVRKWNQFIFKFWTEEKVTRVVSPQGTPFWIKYTGDQIRGEYFLSIDPEAGMPLNRSLKYSMAKDMFASFNGDILIDQIKLRKMLLQNYESVDPLASELLISSPAGVNPDIAANVRSPSAGGREGAGGSRVRPMAFDEAKKRLGGQR
jgi:hypothetical protein